MQDLFDRFQQQFTTKEQEIEAGHQVTHAEDADTCGARDEDDGEDEPEQVAKHNDLQHVKVGPARQQLKIKNNQGSLSCLSPTWKLLAGIVAAKTSRRMDQ